MYGGKSVTCQLVSGRDVKCPLTALKRSCTETFGFHRKGLAAICNRPDRGGTDSWLCRHVYRKVFVLQHAHVRVLCSQAAKGREHVGADWIRPEVDSENATESIFGPQPAWYSDTRR